MCRQSVFAATIRKTWLGKRAADRLVLIVQPSQNLRLDPSVFCPAFSGKRLRRWALCVLSASTWVLGANAGVQLTRLPDRVRVEVDGQLFTEYRFGPDAPKPFFHPILSSDGTSLTRAFPMQSVPGEEQDHPHHRSLWFAHGSVNKVDFWLEKPGVTGRIEHGGLLEVTQVSPELGRFRARNRWVTPAGATLLTDETTVEIRSVHQGRLLDFAITLHASEGMPVVFGDTKEGTMALRVAQWMTLPHRFQGKDVPGQGQMVNREGGAGAGIWDFAPPGWTTLPPGREKSTEWPSLIIQQIPVIPHGGTHAITDSLRPIRLENMTLRNSRTSPRQVTGHCRRGARRRFGTAFTSMKATPAFPGWRSSISVFRPSSPDPAPPWASETAGVGNDGHAAIPHSMKRGFVLGRALVA